ncbi:unnamed protein product [Brachionus calyciflorus]|uniref:Protein phosphatase n=1 Tax=Brachionus calyciflorus TaxID=104777 RepID=A0A813T7I9_9BILA|nr:unnamed protein product [Brachionus calyciflorus]
MQNLECLFENILKLNELSIRSNETKLKYINRTNSNTSCNSDTTSSSSSSGLESGYLSSNSSIYNLIPHSHLRSDASITYGYYGKAKTNNPNDTSNFIKKINSNNENISIIDSINHGDDCGFVLSKNECKSANEESIYYLGLADGVSANRQRGYDAKLFPIALLGECSEYLAQNEYNDEPISEEFLKNNSLLFYSKEYDLISNEQDENDDNDDNDENDDNYQDIDESEVEEEGVFNDIYNTESTDNNSFYYDMNNNDLIESNQNSIDESFMKYSILNNDCKLLYKALKSSHNKVIDKNVYGSSTVCLLALKFINESEYKNQQNLENNFSNYDNDSFSGLSGHTALLSTCNIGDSGYMIIRNKTVIYKSSTQTHRLNAPFQLGCTPPELLDHDLYRDKPEDSLCQTHEIKSGDFILLSSDGLFDNLYEDEIALIIDNHIQSKIKLSMDQLDEISDKKLVNPNLITKELLSSCCEILVQKAANAGIKRDDMLIILVYVN